MTVQNKFKIVIDFLKFNSLFVRNFCLILLLILLPLLSMGVIAYKTVYGVTDNYVSELSTSSLNRVKDTIDSIITNEDMTALKLSIDSNVKLFMGANSINSLEFPDIQKQVRQMISMQTDINKYVDSIYIYSELNDYVLANRDEGRYNNKFSDDSWYEIYKNINGTKWMGVRKGTGTYKKFITIIRTFSFNGSDNVGAVIINIDPNELGKLVDQSGIKTDENIFIVNDSGSILYNKDNSLVNSNAADLPVLKEIMANGSFSTSMVSDGNTNYMSTCVKSDLKGNVYISLIPIKLFNEKFIVMRNLFVILIIISLIASVTVTFLISFKTFRPIKDIIKLMDNPDQWGTDKNSKVNTLEIKYIADKIINMVYTNNHLENELQSRMIMLNKAQYTALQNQITPHFLYNTLENVNWKAIRIAGYENDISRMVTALSKMLHIVMDTKNQLIPLSQEIAHAKYFVEIMNIRYLNKLTVIWEVEDGMSEWLITKISIQPLIENAISHGLCIKRENGTIIIKIYTDNDQGIIDVIDNGKGIEESRLNALNEDMNHDWSMEKSEHIGLHNINLRLKLIFGNKYGIKIHSEEDLETTVRISFPKTAQG